MIHKRQWNINLAQVTQSCSDLEMMSNFYFEKMAMYKKITFIIP